MTQIGHRLRRLPANFLALFGATIIERYLIYVRRRYNSNNIVAFEDRGGVRLNYTTRQGQQAAWLMSAESGKPPEKLWIFCAGNAGLALEWEPFCASLPFTDDAFLLVDYPGYGICSGVPNPKSIRHNLDGAIRAAARKYGFDPLQEPQRLCVFGHSLGAAAALLAADIFSLRTAVLCSPFTTMSEMARQLYYIPRFFPLQNVFDNRRGLRSLAHHNGQAWIVHGGRDEMVPADMSRTLAREFPGTVRLKVVEHAGHNNLIDIHDDELISTMHEARAFVG